MVDALFAFVENNLAVILIVSCVLDVFLFVKLFYLVADNEDNKEFMNYVKGVFAEELQKDFDAVYIEQRKQFIALWEYFYVILAAKGILKVDKEKFITEGIAEFEMKYPKFSEVAAFNSDMSEKEIFDKWVKYYNEGFQDENTR